MVYPYSSFLMKKFFTSLLFFLTLCSAFGQKSPSPNEPGSKEPPQADTPDVQVISVPAGFPPGTSSGPSSTQAISLGSSMIAREEGFDESNNTAATTMPLRTTSVRLRGNIFPVGDVDFSRTLVQAMPFRARIYLLPTFDSFA